MEICYKMLQNKLSLIDDWGATLYAGAAQRCLKW